MDQQRAASRIHVGAGDSLLPLRPSGDAGYRVVNFERYDTPNGVRYLGAWRQNN